MDNEAGAFMRDVALEMCAIEAVCCPICKVSWTGESLKERRAKIANMRFKILVCEACWASWIDICKKNAEWSREALS